MSASQEVPHGLLRINATFGFGRRHLSPAVSDFSRRYPALNMVLELSDRPMDLTAHAMDIGIRFGAPPDSRVLARKIASNRRLLCAAPSYLSARPEPVCPRDLQSHHCIVIRENSSAFNNWPLFNGKQQEMVKVSGPLSTNHGEIAVDWALAGHGILLRSEWDLAPYLRSGQLRRVLAPWEGATADIHAIYPQRHHLSAKVRVFLDFLAERFVQQRPENPSSLAPW